MILLDTCTFLWMVSEPPSISESAAKLIRRHSESLFLSAISAFEIGIKARKGQLELPSKIKEWFDEALEFHGVNELPVSLEIAFQSTQLPPLHRDPCDRMIIATSQIHELTLLTPDPLIRQYPDLKTIW